MAQRFLLLQFTVIVFIASIAIAETPYGLGYQLEGDQYIIYWYYPGTNVRSVQMSGSNPDGYLFVSQEIVHTRVGTDVEVPQGVSAIESVEWYLWGSNPTAMWIGAPTSPFEFALYENRPSTTEMSPIWLSEQVSAQSVAAGGEWVTFPVRCLFAEQEGEAGSIFVEFRWLPETPAAPLPAVTSGLTSGVVWYTIVDGMQLNWEGSYYSDLMVRVNYSENDLGTHLTSSEELPDSFQVNLWAAPEENEISILRLVVADSMHLSVPASETAGLNVTVSAWNEGVLSPKSEAISLDIVTDISVESDNSIYQQENQNRLTAYPNPFNSETLIISSSPAALEIYNLLGKTVTWIRSYHRTPEGKFEFRWDGRDLRGKVVASGLYVVRQHGKKESLRLILLK